MTVEEIAERIVSLKKHGEQETWLLELGPGYRTESHRDEPIIGLPINEREAAHTYAGLLRSVMAEVVKEVIEDCISAVESAGLSAGHEQGQAITAIRRHFGLMLN